MIIQLLLAFDALNCKTDDAVIYRRDSNVSLGQVLTIGTPWTPSLSWLIAITSVLVYVSKSKDFEKWEGREIVSDGAVVRRGAITDGQSRLSRLTERLSMFEPMRSGAAITAHSENCVRAWSGELCTAAAGLLPTSTVTGGDY